MTVTLIAEAGPVPSAPIDIRHDGSSMGSGLRAGPTRRRFPFGSGARRPASRRMTQPSLVHRCRLGLPSSRTIFAPLIVPRTLRRRLPASQGPVSQGPVSQGPVPQGLGATEPGAARSGVALAGGVPPVAASAQRYVRICLEVLNGFRPASHLRTLAGPVEFSTVVSQLSRRRNGRGHFTQTPDPAIAGTAALANRRAVPSTASPRNAGPVAAASRQRRSMLSDIARRRRRLAGMHPVRLSRSDCCACA